MKTKQFIIPTIAFILALTALFYSHYSIATAFFLYLAVNLFIEVKSTISQLTSKLTDTEVQVFMQRDEIKKLTANLEAKKDFEKKQRVKQFELLVEISDLKTQLETAKANSYNEVECKRCREKYNRLYKGKNRSKQEPYTIEGKTIKELVEDNLGVEIDLESYGLFYLCGYDKEFENCDLTANWRPFLIGNDKIANSSYHKDKIILKNYSNVEWCNSELVISAIKKHRNIQ